MTKFISAIFVAGSLANSTLLAQTDPGKPLPEKPDAKGWCKVFDGKTLSGWTAPTPGKWEIKGGVLVGQGPMSHLFSPNSYTNLELKEEVKLNHSGNSGMYFRAALGQVWPKGYEAQVENTSPDPQRTGSLYNLHKIGEQLIPDFMQVVQAAGALRIRTGVFDLYNLHKIGEQLIPDDTWWTQHIIAIGNRIVIK